MSDLGSSVLSRIFPSNREALTHARERLTPEHFSDGIEKVFFSLLDNYADRYNDVLPGDYLKDLLERRKIEPGKVVLYTEVYDTYCKRQVSESAFRYAVDGLLDDLAQKKTGAAFAVGYDILEKGAVVDGETLKGHEAARQYFTRVTNEIETALDAEDAPEGDVREEADVFMREYEERAKNGVSNGILSGINSLDLSTNGLQNGELCLVAAYTNEGKTQMVTQWAWHASVMQGKNVYFATSETVRNQVWRRIIARHSRLPQFGLPNGLNVKNIKDGTLDSDEYAVMVDVLEDLKNPDYGKLFISQIPRNGTLTFMFNRIHRQQKLWNVDLAICDYLPLLKPEVRRGNEREEFNDIIRNTKSTITAFDHGRGLPFISPWQIRREDYKLAVNSGGYTIGSLSDTSEAEKSADLIVSLLRPSPTANEATVQALKARDAAIMAPAPVYLDYRSAYLGESPSSLSGPASSSLDGFQAAGLLGV